jgi:hypothetical protein
LPGVPDGPRPDAGFREALGLQRRGGARAGVPDFGDVWAAAARPATLTNWTVAREGGGRAGFAVQD